MEYEEYSLQTQILALVLVLGLSGVAGLLVGLLDGYKFNGWWIFPAW